MPVHYQDERLRIHKVVASPYDNNAYVIVCRATGESIVVDAPREVDKVLQETQGTRVKSVLITHSHFDHIEGFEAMRGKLATSYAIHQDDAPRLPSPPDYHLEDGDVVPVGNLSLRVLFTPGHTPGGVCLLMPGHLFSGDTLFPGGPGRTVGPAEFRQVVESITARLLPLPADTAVYPGHGAGHHHPRRQRGVRRLRRAQPPARPPRRRHLAGELTHGLDRRARSAPGPRCGVDAGRRAGAGRRGPSVR